MSRKALLGSLKGVLSEVNSVKLNNEGNRVKGKAFLEERKTPSPLPLPLEAGEGRRKRTGEGRPCHALVVATLWSTLVAATLW